MKDIKNRKLILRKMENDLGWYAIEKVSETRYAELYAGNRVDAMLKLAYREPIIFEKQDLWCVLRETLSLALFNMLHRQYLQAFRADPNSVPLYAVELLAYLHKQALEEVKKPDSRHRLYGLRGGVKL